MAERVWKNEAVPLNFDGRLIFHRDGERETSPRLSVPAHFSKSGCEDLGNSNSIFFFFFF